MRWLRKSSLREEFIEIVEGAAEVEGELASSKRNPPSDARGSFLNPMATAFRRELGQ